MCNACYKRLKTPGIAAGRKSSPMTTQASYVVHYGPVGQPLCEYDDPEAAHTPAPTKVHYRDHAYVTSQFYFPDDFTDHVHRQTPYSSRPDRTSQRE